MVLVSVPFLAHSQSSEFSMTPTGDPGSIKVVVGNLYSNIEIVGTSQGEIRIESEGYEGLPEKAAGLRPLSATGPENTGIGLHVSQDGTEIKVSGSSRRSSEADYTIYLPKQINVEVEFNSFQAGDVVVKSMASEVEIQSKIGDLRFEDVTGPIVASTLSADIELVFSSLSQAGPTSITSTSGDIDVTLPANTAGDFDMSTTSGEVYTDMDFEFSDEDGLRRWGGGMSADAKLNGGGVAVVLRSVSGDIFIRKEK